MNCDNRACLMLVAVTFVTVAMLGCGGTVVSNAVVGPGGNPPVVGPGENPAFYGSGLGADGLYNIPLGGAAMYAPPCKVEVSWRFRTKHSGAVQAVRPYLMFGAPGYSSGDGGTVQVELQTDDGTANHLPSGVRLASILHANPLAGEILPRLRFPAPLPELQAGALYHLVFSNTSPDPLNNFVSINHLWIDAPRQVVPGQPTVSGVDLHTLHRENGGAWTDTRYINTTPVFQLDYVDGFVEGRGYIEVWSNSPAQISGGTQTRERFTVSDPNRTVSAVALRLARVSGSGDLRLRLEQGDGTVLEEGTIPASALPLTEPPTSVWVSYTFAIPHTLISGQTYDLVQSAPATSVYRAFPIRKGAEAGLHPATYFQDGRAQMNEGFEWVNWFSTGFGQNRPDSDLQFFFTVIP